jgi:hypothetical protein
MIMDELKVGDATWQLLETELERWTTYGTRACIQSATDDYSFLLERNRRLEV